MKGTSGVQEGTEVSGFKMRAGGQFSSRKEGDRGDCSFSEPSPTEPQSWQAGAISETPSTWLTLFALPWRSPEALSHPNYSC